MDQDAGMDFTEEHKRVARTIQEHSSELSLLPVFKYNGEYESNSKYVEDKNGELYSLGSDFPTDNYRTLPDDYQYIEDFRVGFGVPVEFLNLEPYWDELEKRIDGRVTKFVGAALVDSGEQQVVEWIPSSHLRGLAFTTYHDRFSQEDDESVIRLSDDWIRLINDYDRQKQFVNKKEIERTPGFFVYSSNRFMFYRELYTSDTNEVEFVAVEEGIACSV